MTAKVIPLPPPRSPVPGEPVLDFGRHCDWPVHAVPLTYRLLLLSRKWAWREHPTTHSAVRTSVIGDLIEAEARERV